MSSPAPTRTIVVDYPFPQPPAAVWRALTEPALVSRWLMPTDIRPIVGAEFTFKAPAMPGWDGTVRCQVLEVTPPLRLRYSWRGGPPDHAIDTTVTWTLTAQPDGGTLLRLEHAGFTEGNAFVLSILDEGWRGRIAERFARTLAEL